MKHDCTRCQRLECPFGKRSIYLEFRFPVTFTTRLEFIFSLNSSASSLERH